jgi:RRXRR protein
LAVFVLDTRQKPLMPCCAKRARLFLTGFTIRLSDRAGGEVHPVRVKPASKTTGIAVVAEEDRNKPAKVLCLFELCHRGRRTTAGRPFGLPHGCRLRFTTGAMVRRPRGRRKGRHDGRVAVRDSDAFNRGKAQHITCKHCRRLQRADGSGIAVPAPPVASFASTGFSCRLAPTVAIGRV